MADSLSKDKKRALTNSAPHTGSTDIARIALFWDESFLWGLIAHDTFTELHIDFDLVTSEDIQNGALVSYDVLFVPGGWASNKIKALGEVGTADIKHFVAAGGSYLGFCGGAGLALEHDTGIGLAPVSRKPTSARVPSFSGKIELQQHAPAHSIWNGIADSSSFYAWWPGMFSIRDTDKVNVLAMYGEPEKGSYVADLPVEPSVDWNMWEQRYGTNLNPARIKGEPAVIETMYGSGKVLLSYLHFETPEDELGHTVLLSLLGYLSGGKRPATIKHAEALPPKRPSDGADHIHALTLTEAVRDLIVLGEKQGLWFWRQPWVIQWRRGVRGIEYLTLYSMLQRLSQLTSTCGGNAFAESLADIRPHILSFVEGAKKLLVLEKHAIDNGPITPLTSNNADIQQLREQLFSNAKSFGGFYKEILDRVDKIVLTLLRNNRHP